MGQIKDDAGDAVRIFRQRGGVVFLLTVRSPMA